MKGIILVRDLSVAEIVARAFPDWLVLASTEPKEAKEAVEFYPIPVSAK